MRLSRGRSTPTRRAIRWRSLRSVTTVSVVVASRPPRTRSGRCSGGGSAVLRRPSDHVVVVFSCAARCRSALALLVAGVVADHHDSAVATDHLALVTDLLHARVDLHLSALPCS